MPFVVDLVLARFVTAGVIDPFGKLILARSDSWLGHQGAKTQNTKSAVTPEAIAGSAPNFYHGYI
jgi:hypothetical protein